MDRFNEEGVLISRTCTKCNIEKDVFEFYRKKGGKYERGRVCKACEGQRIKQWKRNNPEKIKGYRRKNYEKDREKVLERGRKWKEQNKDKIKEYTYKRYWSDPDKYKEERKFYYQKDIEKSRLKSRLRVSKYKKEMVQATPKWMDKEEIEYIYKLASEKGLEVDHIVPIISKYVCGLHTGDNLRCIPAKLNRHKSNSYWSDMWEYDYGRYGEIPTAF